MFIDKCRVFIKSGSGGPGKLSFLRLKFMPNGGPNGGNGGKGGDVYFKGDHSMNTLYFFRYNKNFIAKNGNPGEDCNKNGSDAEDMIIKVPIGSVLTLETGEIIEILNEEPVKILIGGKGGIGNGNLASSFRQAPRFTIPEGVSEEMFVDIELKLIGDVGLVGLPNAGKSSFINSCTKANSKIGDYAFTTLEPKLGTYKNLILVDLPGLIEGASEGKGLGFQFLSHIERCKTLLFLADIADNPIAAVETVLKEIESYGFQKDFIIGLNKIELQKKKHNMLILKILQEKYGKDRVFLISIHKKSGIKNLLRNLEKRVSKITSVPEYF